MASNSNEEDSSALTAHIKRQGNNYSLKLKASDGRLVKMFPIDSSSQKMDDSLTLIDDDDGDGCDDNNNPKYYSNVTKGSSFLYDGKQYRVVEDPPFKTKNIDAELAKIAFHNNVAEPRQALFGRQEAKEVVMEYITDCIHLDPNVFSSGKFTMLGISGVKGIGKTEIQQQICGGKWLLKEEFTNDVEGVYASYGHAAPYCTDVKAIEKNLLDNDRVGYYMDSLGHLLLVAACGVDTDTAIQVPIDKAIDYIRNKKFGKGSDDGTLVICVDDILELNNSPVPGYYFDDLEGNNNKSMMSLAQVIMKQCMGLQDNRRGKIIFIFTSILDSMYTKMISGYSTGRPVRRLPLSLIPFQDVFDSMLTNDSLKGLIRSHPAVHQLVLSCAGHPRAVIDGLKHATATWCTDQCQWKDKKDMKSKLVIARAKIIEECKFAVDYINDTILAEWFDTPQVSAERRQDLLFKGILHEAAAGVEYLFPLLLQQWANLNKESSIFAYHLCGLFDADAQLGPYTDNKSMEPVMYHFEALRRKAMAEKPFDLKSFYQTENVGEKFMSCEVIAPVPTRTTSLVRYVKTFDDMKQVLHHLRLGYIVVSEKATETGIEYLVPYQVSLKDGIEYLKYSASNTQLMVACVQCKFVQQAVKWPKMESEMEKAVKRLKEEEILHFPVIYTTSDQRKVSAKSCDDGVYLIEKDIFAFTKRVGILRLHTQKLGKVLAEEYTFLKGSTIVPLEGSDAVN